MIRIYIWIYMINYFWFWYKSIWWSLHYWVLCWLLLDWLLVRQVTVEVIAHKGDVPNATVGRRNRCKIFLHGVLNIIGVRAAASALCHMKVEEMQMPCITVQMDQLMLGYGKLIRLIGHAMEVMLLVIQTKIWNAPSAFTRMQEIAGNPG